MRNYVTDRTQTDVDLDTRKGSYGPEDLNRVEAAVAALGLRLAQWGEALKQPQVKTDWSQPDLFDAAQWPTREQMTRYLSNIEMLLAVYGLEAQLPGTMEKLTWQGANQIEQQLMKLEQMMENTQAAWQQCGAAESGG